MAPDPLPLLNVRSTPPPDRWRWHVASLATLALAALFNAWDWLARDRMPPGDFAGYVTQVQYVRDALLEHGRVPLWCAECYGGTTNFTGHLKEYLTFPLALRFDPVVATKLAFLILKVAAGFCLYALVTRFLAAPAAGIIAGYALAFGAIANHEIEHLDAALASALIPLVVLASVELLRRGGILWVVSLGVLAACQLVNNWTHALSVPAMVVALAVFRPGLAADVNPWCDARVAWRWLGRVGAALGVFFAFAASQLAWIALDAENHSLVPALPTVVQRETYIERSPFLFVNRENVLAPWLDAHQPPGMNLAKWDGGRRYVGAVCLAVCAIGALAMRGARGVELRRWSAAAAVMLWLQYWLSLGPRTLLWEVGTSLHWPSAVQEAVRTGLLATSSVCGVLAVALGVRATRSPGARWRPARRALGASVVLCFPAASLWAACARVLPVLEVQRSPGHFFDVAPVWLYLLFAVALAAIARRIARPRWATALLAGVAAAVVFDFAPSRRQFSEGVPMAELRPAGARLASLPGEGGTLRIGMPMSYAPLASWLIAQSSAGHAWGWLPWQAGRDWPGLLAAALYGKAGPGPDGTGPIEPDGALLRAARVRYLLLTPGSAGLPEPWRLLDQLGGVPLWQQPGELPIARGHRRHVVLPEPASGQADVVSRALQANVLAISLSGSPAGAGEALASWARASVSPGDPAPADFSSAPAPVGATVERPQPERIVVEIDAGGEPAVVSVSEGHHPWWRASVDGEPAPVLRANLAMLAVPVGPGAHRIELRFERPALVAFADGITAAAWIALSIGAAAAIGMRARRAARARRAG